MIWLIMECQNRFCASRENLTLSQPRRRGGRWPLSQKEANNPADTNHLCPSCEEPGRAIKQYSDQAAKVLKKRKARTT